MNAAHSESYRWLIKQEAWRDLSEVMEKIIQDSTRELDTIPVEQMSIAVAAHGRGMRDAVARLRHHVDYRVNGGPKP